MSVVILVSLLVCLIPTTIGALLSAIGIAGMDRLVQRNVLAMSGRAVEAAGDVQTLLLDKTGTITLGNRMASDFFPVGGPHRAGGRRRRSARLPRRRDTRRTLDRGARQGALRDTRARAVGRAHVRAFHRNDPDVRTRLRAGAASARVRPSRSRPGRPRRVARYRRTSKRIVDRVARAGSTPLVVADGPLVLGVIELKDVVKQGIQEKFAEMRQMGIRTVMITGDNPLTAAAIAQEAGVDSFLAEATPETKMDLIKSEQEGGNLVAMTGDGTNDAPALAQADVGVAMNTGTTAAKEAGNMVDLDSNPTKLIDIVEIGKQLLITRGSLTTFSIANDVAKYFAIIPALFATLYEPDLPAARNPQHHEAPQPGERRALRGDLQRSRDRGSDPSRAQRSQVPRGQLCCDPEAQRLDLRGGRDHRPVHLHKADRPHPRRAARLLMSGPDHAHPPSSLCRPGAHQPRDLRRFAYAFVGTGVSQLFFKGQADGSITSNGSTLIGQNWADTKCPGHPLGSCVFQGRPDDLGPYSSAETNPAEHPGDDPLEANGAAWRIRGDQPRAHGRQSLVTIHRGARRLLACEGCRPDPRSRHHLGQAATTPTSLPADAIAQIPMVSAATGHLASRAEVTHLEGDPW